MPVAEDVKQPCTCKTVGSRAFGNVACGACVSIPWSFWCRLHKDESWREPAHALHEFEQMCNDVVSQCM